MDENGLVSSACSEIVYYTKEERKSVLIFACGVSHALHIADEIEKLGEKCEMVCGDTPDGERADILARFKAGSLKYLANVNVLTTGFDAPNIDCVAMVRPTMSPGLYYQMVGRGFRLCEGKENALILDFGGNVMRHGPIDAMRIVDDHDRKNGRPMAKTCPNCQLLVALGCAICPGCGHNFPPREDREINHDSMASDAKILDEDSMRDLIVQRVSYCVHKKKNADDDAPKTLRVTYRVGLTESVSEWICIEHNGRPGMSARQWWSARTKDPYPSSAAEAVEIAAGGGLKEATQITVKHTAGEYFDRIVAYVLGNARPVALLPEEADEIPF
jgi:DNA repair protein RadD